MIRPYRGKKPEIAASAYIDPAAIIIGDVIDAIGGDTIGAAATGRSVPAAPAETRSSPM